MSRGGWLTYCSAWAWSPRWVLLFLGFRLTAGAVAPRARAFSLVIPLFSHSFSRICRNVWSSARAQSSHGVALPVEVRAHGVGHCWSCSVGWRSPASTRLMKSSDSCQGCSANQTRAAARACSACKYSRAATAAFSRRLKAARWALSPRAVGWKTLRNSS